jgi:hypothetical protein
MCVLVGSVQVCTPAVEVEVRPWREIEICASTQRTLLSGLISTMVSPTSHDPFTTLCVEEIIRY